MAEGRTRLSQLLARVQEVVGGPGDRDEKLSAICEILRDGVPYYDWVGFYIADQDEKVLVLGPFVGDPTEHVRIPYGRGICGRVAQKTEPLIIDDVSGESNYLACSPGVKSEIVVPVFRDGRFAGEIDIDSHTRGAFSENDRVFLEEVSQSIAKLF